MTMPSQLGKRLSLAAVILTFLVAWLAHAAYVHTYGVDLPIWDEWGGEGYFLLKPWAEGHFGLAGLVAGWNEHRIAFTRLVSIAAFEASGGAWSVMNVQYVNAAIFALIPSALMLVVTRAPVARQAKLFVAILVIALAMLPYAWENTLGAFQSQFYFVILSAVAGTMLAANGPLTWPRAAVLAAWAAGAIFTMAPGVVTGAALAFVIVCRAWLGQVPRGRAIAVAVVLLAISAIGQATAPVVEAHHAMHAASILEFVHVFIRVMAWPATSPHAGFVLCWLPTAVAAWMLLRRRWGTSADVAMLGLAAWTVVQAAGIAYSRGHDMVQITPRYLDVLAIGLVTNAWFALRLAVHAPAGALRRVPAFVFSLVVAQGFIAAQPTYEHDMAERRDQVLMQRTHVQAYLRAGVPAELDQPVPAGSLPNPADMRMVLDDPTIRRMLRTVDATAGKAPVAAGSAH